jgi:hypothetical protein
MQFVWDGKLVPVDSAYLSIMDARSWMSKRGSGRKIFDVTHDLILCLEERLHGAAWKPFSTLTRGAEA